MKYLFIGDVFGNLYFYIGQKKQPLIESFNFEELSADINIIKNLGEYFELSKSLSDHSSEIKYIDYNPRLNLLVDYALDGYINIYTVPKFKLIQAIQTKDFNNNNQTIKYVILISNPFPIICCICSKVIFVLDINGLLINTIPIESDQEPNFCIDKNCGLFNDYISFNNSKGKEKIDLLNEN